MDLRRLLGKLQSKLLYSAYSKLCRTDFSVQRPWTSASKTNLHHNRGGISQHKGLSSLVQSCLQKGWGETLHSCFHTI
nr:uncharacterized protein LOC100436494 isoform X3 [Pongo abelii]